MALRRAHEHDGERATRGHRVRLRRTWSQRAVLTVGSLASVSALAMAGTLTLVKVRFDQVPRVDIQADGFVPAGELASDAPRNILIVGADDASTLDPGSPELAGREDVGGIRSDTIMLVRLDPAAKTAQILSFPRDLWVDIPGHAPNKINATLEFGGEELLIETLQAEFDLEVNSYVQLDFQGFKRLVDEVDGVPMYFETPVADGSEEGSSGLDIATPGCTTLTGEGDADQINADVQACFGQEQLPVPSTEPEG